MTGKSMKSTSDQHKLLTGWIPVVKIFNTRNRGVRGLWLLFTVTMVVALVSSISVVVHRYFSYVTVVRLDQRATQDDMPPPSVTICLSEHAISQSGLGDLDNWNIIGGVSKPCSLAAVQWNSTIDAVSPLYARGGHFSVTLKPKPDGCYSLKVFEQVPRPPNSVCTTFELTPSTVTNHTFWKIFTVNVVLAENGRQFKSRPLLIAHDKGSFPLDNYGRYIYEYLTPGTTMNIFYSRIVTKRLQTWGRPCGSKPVKLLGHYFNYDQIVCQWDTVCDYYHAKCNCLCPLELIHRKAVFEGGNFEPADGRRDYPGEALQPECPYACDHTYPVSRVNASVCPLACETVRYKSLNQVMDSNAEASGVQITLIQAEGFTEETEEELYSLPKLFSEIGGLSSFCFGFSCMLFCELFELIFWIRCVYATPTSLPVPSSIWEQARSLLHLNHQTPSTSSGSSFHAEDIGQDGRDDGKEKRHRSRSAVFCLENETGAGTVTETVDEMQQFLEGRRIRRTIQALSKRTIDTAQCRKDCAPVKTARRLQLPRCSQFRSRRLSLSPHKLCRVDGSRLSGYPSDQDSPIWSHSQRNPTATVDKAAADAESSLEQSNKRDSESELELVTTTLVLVEVRDQVFRVPLDIFRRKSSL